MEEYRRQLNELDGKMVKLYVQRMKIAEQIGRYKKANGLPVKDEIREQELLNRLAQQAGEVYEEGLRCVYGEILEQSCALQEKILAEPMEQ